MRYTTRPLSDRTWLRPASARVASRFDSTWTSTLRLLTYEINQLRGTTDVVIECDLREQDIRLDGGIRANARLDSPAVVVAFDTAKHGPMLYRCDRYNGRWGVAASMAWQENVRAIALTLQGLRAIDRYGATQSSQQYQGFKALPAGNGAGPSPMTADEAWSIIGSYGHHSIHVQRQRAGLDPSQAELRAAYRKARAANHPDRHAGDRSLWDQVEEAARVLGVAT